MDFFPIASLLWPGTEVKYCERFQELTYTSHGVAEPVLFRSALGYSSSISVMTSNPDPALTPNVKVPFRQIFFYL